MVTAPVGMYYIGLLPRERIARWRRIQISERGFSVGGNSLTQTATSSETTSYEKRIKKLVKKWCSPRISNYVVVPMGNRLHRGLGIFGISSR